MNRTCYSDLRWKLKPSDIINGLNFKAMPLSTCSFRFEEFAFT